MLKEIFTFNHCWHIVGDYKFLKFVPNLVFVFLRDENDQELCVLGINITHDCILDVLKSTFLLDFYPIEYSSLIDYQRMCMLHNKTRHSKELACFWISACRIWSPSETYTDRALIALFIPKLNISVRKLLLRGSMMKADEFELINDTSFIPAHVMSLKHDSMR